MIVKLPMWTVVSVTISWSQRKYQGALAGFGVMSALAASSSGERSSVARMLMSAIVPSTAMAVRRVRSGTAFTVRSGASRVVVRIAGAVPRATPRSV